MSPKKKVGIYGGTFNPPHIGHIGAAESFAKYVDLDELIIMPDFIPPHKSFEVLIDPDDRLQMCRLAFSNINKSIVSDLEITRGGKSYTAITLEQLSADDIELYFLCGTDMFLTLEYWYSFKKIFELATICFVRRESDLETDSKINEHIKKYKEAYNARIIPITANVIEVSSSELREKLKCGEETELLSSDVYEYIKQKGLYK